MRPRSTCHQSEEQKYNKPLHHEIPTCSLAPTNSNQIAQCVWPTVKLKTWKFCCACLALKIRTGCFPQHADKALQGCPHSLNRLGFSTWALAWSRCLNLDGAGLEWRKDVSRRKWWRSRIPVLSRLCASCVCPGNGELVAACEGLPVSGPWTPTCVPGGRVAPCRQCPRATHPSIHPPVRQSWKSAGLMASKQFTVSDQSKKWGHALPWVCGEGPLELSSFFGPLEKKGFGMGKGHWIIIIFVGPLGKKYLI